MPEALPGDPDRHAQGGRHREQRVGPFERGFFFPCRWQLVGKTITTRSGSASRALPCALVQEDLMLLQHNYAELCRGVLLSARAKAIR